MKKKLPLLFFLWCLIALVGRLETATKPTSKETLKAKYLSGNVTFVPMVRFDNESLPEQQAYKYLNDLAITPDKTLFLLETNQSRIKIVDAQGRFIKSFGQKGAGPGDLGEPTLIFISGSQLVVWERQNQRFSFFSFNGQFIKIQRADLTWDLRQIRPMPAGYWLLEREIGTTDKKTRQETLYCQVEQYWPERKETTPIFKVPVIRFVDLKKPFQIRAFLPFNPDVAWETTPAGNLVYCFQQHYRIYWQSLQDLKAKPVSVFHQVEPIPIVQADKETVYNTYQMVGDEGVQKAPKVLTEQIPFPAYRPVVGKLVVDGEGNTLVFPFKAFPHEIHAYFDAFESSGKLIKRVQLGTKIRHFTRMIFDGAEAVWVLAQSEEEEDALIKYRLQ